MLRYDETAADELGAATLAEAKGDVGIGESCPNWGPEVAVFLKTVGITFPANWCAAAMQTWIIRASVKTQIVPPVSPTEPAPAMARGVMAQMQQRGRWIDRSAIALAGVQPGWVVVWDRSTPQSPYAGHIGIVESVQPDKGTFGTIDGNSGPSGTEVARNVRQFADGRLYGFGVLSGPMPWQEAVVVPRRGVSLGQLAAGAFGFAVGAVATVAVARASRYRLGSWNFASSSSPRS